MSERCGYCTLQILLAQAKRTNSRVVAKSCGFGPEEGPGTDLFTVPVGEVLGKYKQPTKSSPKGDKAFQEYCLRYKRVFLPSIPYKCECSPQQPEIVLSEDGFKMETGG